MNPLDADTLRTDLKKLLGPSYQRVGLSQPELLSTTDFNGWKIDDLQFESPDGENVPAYFLRPPEGAAPVPAIIYAHAHGNRYDFGRQELLQGRPTLRGAYAHDLQQAGIAALCIEMPCFGSRQTPDETQRTKTKLWRGDTLFGQMLSEQRAGLDFLAEHEAIDGSRMGALGFSMGSTLAFWLAALDTRVKAASALCSFADLETLIELDAHHGHGIYMTVPGLVERTRTGQIAGLAAPRALHICAGFQDWSTPKEAFDLGATDLSDAYRAHFADSKLDIYVDPEASHEETPEMRARVLKFLSREL